MFSQNEKCDLHMQKTNQIIKLINYKGHSDSIPILFIISKEQTSSQNIGNRKLQSLRIYQMDFIK
jgi:hypothetical protein